MNDFTYYTPTEVVFGKNTESKVGELAKKYGATKVLIHYGSGSAERSGLIARIEDSLKNAGIEYVKLGGVQPNPRLSLARKGITLAKEEKGDFILAVGGGSVIDSSKCIAYGLANEGDVWDFFKQVREPAACAPVGAVLTIAAAGSEMSNSCVITNEDGMLKRSVNRNMARCKFAVLNPELTYTLPPYQTASGCVDIMMHIMERYFTCDERIDLVDGMAESTLRTMIKYAPVLLEEPENYEARSYIACSSHSSLSK